MCKAYRHYEGYKYKQGTIVAFKKIVVMGKKGFIPQMAYWILIDKNWILS